MVMIVQSLLKWLLMNRYLRIFDTYVPKPNKILYEQTQVFARRCCAIYCASS